MTPALHNRLVGTVILVALAVIFLPDFLDRKKETNQDEFVSVPATPAKKPIVDPEPFPVDRVAGVTQRPLEVVDEPAVDDEAAQVAASSEKAQQAIEDDLARQTVVEQPAPEAVEGSWVVQLGSFRHQKNVKQLLVKLEQAGYRAFSRPVETRSGPLTKVFVGPDTDKAKLQKAVPHLQEITGLKGKVATFNAE
ncbi:MULTISPECIES: SPOR domain-containing protein [Gammaproteobacteria]|uniref:SPOR domain-containing protein n=1 Tax=Gammaproteobacteria TaxID=1236 RepID=UPI000E6953D2|nr:SPOR domain-containing protein [Alteromonas sp. RKMC-009]AYA64961.1 SPOR domain-containing protein [Alteromonas sp. RKMC-009]MEC7692326.1 SPOR domain-containing protein [Pseudomonadota bacterium]